MDEAFDIIESATASYNDVRRILRRGSSRSAALLGLLVIYQRQITDTPIPCDGE